MIEQSGFEFEAARIGRNIVITLTRVALPGQPHTREEINATFSISTAEVCIAEIDAAIDEVHTLAECDCCGKEAPLSRCWAGGIETFACEECRS